MKKVLIFVFSFYKKAISGSIKLLFGGGCRFSPTCSDYAKGSVEKHGAFWGSVLTIKRISRCHPLGGFGYDPVPDKL